MTATPKKKRLDSKERRLLANIKDPDLLRARLVWLGHTGHPYFTDTAWRYEVAKGKTPLGYWEWVLQEVKKEVTVRPERYDHLVSVAFSLRSDNAEDDVAREELLMAMEACLSDLRHSRPFEVEAFQYEESIDTHTGQAAKPEPLVCPRCDEECGVTYYPSDRDPSDYDLSFDSSGALTTDIPSLEDIHRECAAVYCHECGVPSPVKEFYAAGKENV